MGEEELRLQIQLERLLLYPLRRLPPGVRVAERGVAHGRWRVLLAGDGRVTPAARCRRARPPAAAGGGGLSVEAEGLRGVEAAHRPSAQHSTQGQVAHAGVAGSSRAAVIPGFRRYWGEKVCVYFWDISNWRSS